MNLLLAGALLLWSCTVAHAQLPPAPPELVALADYLMRENPSPSELAARAETTTPAIDAAASAAARTLYLAMREFLIGFGDVGNGALAEAEDRFERAAGLALAANREAPSSEGYRVLADAYNQLLDLRSPAYKILNAGGARRAAIRAVELDPANPLAHITAAGFFVSAPPIAGGDLARGRKHLRAAARVTDGSDYQRFLLAVWEGRLAAAEGRSEEAVRALAAAHRIYPGNWWLTIVAESLAVELPG